MKLVNKYSVIDFARFAFNSNNSEASYVYPTTYYDRNWLDDFLPLDDEDDIDTPNIKVSNAVKRRVPREAYIFNCEKCHNAYDVEELKIMNQTIHCKCGHSVRIDELRPYSMMDNYYTSSEVLSTVHNVKNGTHNKLNVPTILRNVLFYCPECHETKDIYTYKKENGVLTCDCGAHYTFDECKIELNTGRLKTISGGLYFDGNKISISLIKQYYDTDRYNKYYWSTGNSRATMNLET